MPEPAVTAVEWLDAHRAAQAEEDAHRDITDTDLDDHQAEASTEGSGAQEAADEIENDDREPPAEPADADIREIAAQAPPPSDEDNVRIPSADETSAAIDRANRALAEMRARDELDAEEESDHRAEQLAEWQVRDTATASDDEASDGPLVDASDEIDGGAEIS